MTDRKVIISSAAPVAIGPYSQGMRVGKVVYVSGQLGIDPESSKMVSDSVGDQTRQALRNIKAILAEEQMDLGDVVQCQVFLDNMDSFAEMNEIYAEFFPENPPTRAAFEVSRLPAGGKVEILATAVKR